MKKVTIVVVDVFLFNLLISYVGRKNLKENENS